LFSGCGMKANWGGRLRQNFVAWGGRDGFGGGGFSVGKIQNKDPHPTGAKRKEIGGRGALEPACFFAG